MISFPVENRKNDKDTLLVSDNSKLEKKELSFKIKKLIVSVVLIWRCGDLNPGPPACEAGALPLSYIPGSNEIGMKIVI